jgi:hypothetical protein
MCASAPSSSSAAVDPDEGDVDVNLPIPAFPSDVDLACLTEIDVDLEVRSYG